MKLPIHGNENRVRRRDVLASSASSASDRSFSAAVSAVACDSMASGSSAADFLRLWLTGAVVATGRSDVAVELEVEGPALKKSRPAEGTDAASRSCKSIGRIGFCDCNTTHGTTNTLRTTQSHEHRTAYALRSGLHN
jgi:hypothetical protein